MGNHDPPSTLPVGTIALATSFVFGGCCTNAWSLERLLKDNPSVGSALTFCQCIFIIIQYASESIAVQPFPHLKPRHVPLRQWLSQVFILTSMSLLNNWAFAFRVPLALQIVFRSAGLAVSMVLGYLFLNKTYSRLQVLSVVVVTAGVLVATMSRPAPSPPPNTISDTRIDNNELYQYFIGIAMLSLATVLTSTLGILQERTYAQYGSATWREGMFYTHLFSLPIFCIFMEDIRKGLRSLSSSPGSLPLKIPLVSSLGYDTSVPLLYLVLALNIASQSVCVSGASLLNSNVSAVSTNLVLTARKALSLCISVWYFGQGMNLGLGIGACMVLLGTLLYSYATSAVKRQSQPKTRRLESSASLIKANGIIRSPNAVTNGSAKVHIEILAKSPKYVNGNGIEPGSGNPGELNLRQRKAVVGGSN